MYPSMNAIRMSRATTGLAGGTSQPAPQGGTVSLGGGAPPAAAPPNQNYLGGLNVSDGRPQYQDYKGSAQAGMNQTAMVNNYVGQHNMQGVATQLSPGAIPQMQDPAPVQFDPNDPNNAALAGYMSGGGTGMMGT